MESHLALTFHHRKSVELRFDNEPLPFDTAITVSVLATQLHRGVGFPVLIEVIKRPASAGLVFAFQLYFRVAAMVQIDHPVVAGKPLKQIYEAVAIAKAAQRAEIDAHVARREALADDLNVFGVASIQVAVFQCADLFQGLKAGNTLLQFHSGRSFSNILRIYEDS